MCNFCTSGREYDCAERTIWGFQTGPLWGGFAQYTHLPEVNVAKLPDNVSFNDVCGNIHGRNDCMAHVSWKGQDNTRSNST